MLEKETKSKADETTQKLKNILVNKDKVKKVDKSANENNKQSKKVKQRKTADPSYRTKFVDKAVAKFPNIEIVEKADRLTLKYGPNALCRLMVRSGHRFTVY
jgi:hypothetical protein